MLLFLRLKISDPVHSPVTISVHIYISIAGERGTDRLPASTSGGIIIISHFGESQPFYSTRALYWYYNKRCVLFS